MNRTEEAIAEAISRAEQRASRASRELELLRLWLAVQPDDVKERWNEPKNP